MPTKKQPTNKSHLAAGLIAGAALGVAAAYFLNTPKGKKMLQHAEKKAMEMQRKLMRELNKTEHLTKDKYTQIVENIVKYYAKTKEISSSEVPEIKRYLLGKYKQIEKEYKSV